MSQMIDELINLLGDFSDTLANRNPKITEFSEFNRFEHASIQNILLTNIKCLERSIDMLERVDSHRERRSAKLQK